MPDTDENLPTRSPGWFSYRLIVVALFILVGATVALAYVRRSDANAPLDDDLVAIFPFRMEGVDPSTNYLREGMIDLLAAKLTGEPAPRATDAGTLLKTLKNVSGGDSIAPPRHTAIDVARRLGAGRLVLGEVGGNSARLVLNARIVATGGGEILAHASMIGPADSLSQLVDGLVAQLLARGAGEGERLGTLTSTSLPALRAYLNGQALYRRGQFREASADFINALEADSTFALAALRLASAASWLGDPQLVQRGNATAWRNRHRLTALDRVMLEAVVGPRYPFSSSYSELLAARRRYVSLAPQRPDAWFEIGDAHFHFGYALGIDDPHGRAAEAFERAIAIDSGYLPAVEHLMFIAAGSGDTALIARLLPTVRALVPESENADGTSWRIAVAIGDSATADAIVRRRREINLASGHTIVQLAQLHGVELEAADSVAVAQAETSPPEFRVITAQNLYDLAMNRGQPARALRVNRGYVSGTPVMRYAFRERARAMLYWDGDSATAHAAIRSIEPFAYAPDIAGIPWPTRLGHFADLCVMEQWKVERGDLSTARRSAELLRAGGADPEGAEWRQLNEGCALMLEAMVATEVGDADARERVGQLDSLMRTGLGTFMQHTGNIVLARLLEQHGDHSGALAAVRRRDFFLNRTTYLSTYLREEGRLAALTGDRRGAISAYSHYLALRRNPEPALLPEVEQVRAELARLEREARN
jgi:tetratricopeptide (TPR) repeat protein